jgi:hypothetical protein
MALIAAVLDEEGLAVGGVGGESEGPEEQNQYGGEENLVHDW